MSIDGVNPGDDIQALHACWNAAATSLEDRRGQVHDAKRRHGEFPRFLLRKGQFSHDDRVAVISNRKGQWRCHIASIRRYPVYKSSDGHKPYLLSDLDFEFYFEDRESDVCADGRWDDLLQGDLPSAGKARAYLSLYIATLCYRNPRTLDKIVQMFASHNIRIYQENGDHNLARACQKELACYHQLGTTEKMEIGLKYVFLNPREDDRPLVLQMAEAILSSKWVIRDFAYHLNGTDIGICVPRNLIFSRNWETRGLTAVIPIHRYKLLSITPYGYTQVSSVYSDWELHYTEAIKDAMRDTPNSVELWCHVDDAEMWSQCLLPAITERLHIREIAA